MPETLEEYRDVKRKTDPIHTKMLFVGDIKDTTSLGCFIDIKYERWGICYGLDSRYALITTDTMYIKDNARYKAFLDSYEEAVGNLFEPAPTDDAATKFTKTFGTVGLAVATGGASLAAQKLYDDNKMQAEKLLSYACSAHGILRRISWGSLWGSEEKVL